MNNESYVLITPARNEESYIEKTIQSVITQTILPVKWVIVSDGSTDRTDEIVKTYAAEYDFIQLVQKKADQTRNFGSKATAIKLGYDQLKHLDFGYVGNLDADVSFAPSYYENILSKFKENKQLGIAGGIRYDLCQGKFRRVVNSRNSVGGPFQLFTRQCYEQIGGYMPLKFGGIDAVAEISARMHGWDVESFETFVVYHYRQTGTANKGVLSAHVKSGIKDYFIGYHPLFQVVRCLYRLTDKPLIIGSLCVLTGYFGAALKKDKRSVSDDFVKYLRKEQLTRLQAIFQGLCHV